MNRLWLISLLAGALGVASAAQAELIKATFTGVIDGTYGDSTVYDWFGDTLIGHTVTAIYTIDDSKGVSAYDPPDSSQIYGGPPFGISSPVTAAITVNNITVDIVGTYQSQANQHASAGGYSSLDYLSQNRTYSSSAAQDVFSYDGAYSATDNFVTSYNYHVIPVNIPISDITQGLFDETVYDNANDVLSYSQFGWEPTSLSIAAISVPEPAAWVLMLLGFGGIGAALRRGKMRRAGWALDARSGSGRFQAGR